MIFRLQITFAMTLIALVGTAPIGVHGVPIMRTTSHPGLHKPSFILVAATPKSLTDSTLAIAEAIATRGVISSDKNTIFYSQRTVRLVVHTGPDNDMLSYRVNELRNPTIYVKHGAILRVLFVNNDGDMFHNIRVGAKPRRFENTTDSLLKTSVGTRQLAHVSGKTLHGTEMVIQAPDHPGKYAYFCTVRGHAQGGMWGLIQIR